jgi:hypothetical protein
VEVVVAGVIRSGLTDVARALSTLEEIDRAVVCAYPTIRSENAVFENGEPAGRPLDKLVPEVVVKMPMHASGDNYIPDLMAVSQGRPVVWMTRDRNIVRRVMKSEGLDVRLLYTRDVGLYQSLLIEQLVLIGQWHHVSYEALVQSPMFVMNDLIRTLGLTARCTACAARMTDMNCRYLNMTEKL